MPNSTGVVSCYPLNLYLFFYLAQQPPSGPGPPHSRGFYITLRHTTLGRTPLDEWRARRGDLYLTTHDTHSRQTSMSPEGFEPTIPANKRPQSYALDRAATGIGQRLLLFWNVALLRFVGINAPFEMPPCRLSVQLFCILESPNKTHDLMAFKKRY
jgi:hypothetical protein